MSTLQGDLQIVEEKVLEIKFPGEKTKQKYSDIKARLLKKKEPVVEETGKKDPKKK